MQTTFLATQALPAKVQRGRWPQPVGPACRAGPRTTGGLPYGETPVRCKVAGRSRSASGTYSKKSLRGVSGRLISGPARRGPTANRASRRIQAACQMESRSWGNLTRCAGSMSLPTIGQITGHTGSPVLHSAEERLSGEGAPASTFHSDAHPLLLSPAKIITPPHSLSPRLRVTASPRLPKSHPNQPAQPAGLAQPAQDAGLLAVNWDIPLCQDVVPFSQLC